MCVEEIVGISREEFWKRYAKIAEGQIKLVQLPDDEGEPKPKILVQAELKTVFAAVKGA
jgi:hypothetical protein